MNPKNYYPAKASVQEEGRHARWGRAWRLWLQPGVPVSAPTSPLEKRILLTPRNSLYQSTLSASFLTADAIMSVDHLFNPASV
jgi:hypothetical protein